jgi:hypothetical protein
MKDKEDFNIKWDIARQVIHLGYEYDDNKEPTQWDFIFDIEDEDLIEFYYYCALQKYTKCPLKDYQDLTWNKLNQLIKLECDYRELEL